MTKKNVIVLGLGLSGRAASHFLLRQGNCVYGIDKECAKLFNHSEIVPLRNMGLTFVEELPASLIGNFDLIIVSPGIRSDHPILVAAHKAKVPCIGEIELGCRHFTNTALGVTGTNGKTTVTKLITHVLNSCQKSAKSLGNVGDPLTKELIHNKFDDDIFVIELSSYQIETLHTPCLESGVILNITPDHLDRYHSFEDYAKAKCLLSRAIKPRGTIYIEEKTWKHYGHFLDNTSVKLFGYEPSSYIYTDLEHVFHAGKKVFSLPTQLSQRKSHDTENLLASYALCSEFGISGKDFITHWNTFKKPPHRIELFEEKGGVHFFDDSKGTNIDATLRAVEAMQGNVFLIAGGVDKCFPYTSWIQGFKGKVKHVFAIGQAAKKIKDELYPHIFVSLCSSLEEATIKAMKLAQKGDNVLLSPGCASFDMFRDYAHRGEEFQRIVRENLK